MLKSSKILYSNEVGTCEMISEKVLLEIEDTLERFKDTLEAVGITDPACYSGA